MTFPYLSAMIFLPLLSGVVILLLPARNQKAIKVIAVVGACAAFILSLIVYLSYNLATGGYQFIEKIPWVPALDIAYHVGVDGISAPLLLLTGVVTMTGVLVSWGIDDRPKEFFSFLMFLSTSVLGVFASLDVFQLFFFFEIAVFPKYLMIVMWGWPKTRDYGGMKLTLYLFIGSMVALAGMLVLIFFGNANTFNLLALGKIHFSPQLQLWCFPLVFFGFAVLGGIFPFYSWAPDGHVAAPTAISMLLAGVEMKVGAFAALRLGIMLMPDGARFWAPLILVLAVINVVYGALVAMSQSDFKYVIGFSSVSHMGLVFMGFATLSREGLLGAGLQMFSHGVMTALFFAVVGMVYDRAHTRNLPDLGGLARKMPWAAVAFIIGGLVSMGMPGFSGFVAEFPIFMGVWRMSPVAAIVGILGVIITAAYILRVVGRVFFGELPEGFQGIKDITGKDKFSLALLSLILISLGILPNILMSPWIQAGTDYILRLVGGG
jgi:NADH-quinone oxidoreductase subunit M